jgi:hypothetical protein
LEISQCDNDEEDIDVENPIICLNEEVDVVATDNQAIFSTSKLFKSDSFEGRKQSFSKLFNSKLSNRSIREEDKTASIQFDSEEMPGSHSSPAQIKIISEESPPDSKLLNASLVSPISPLKLSVVGTPAR